MANQNLDAKNQWRQQLKLLRQNISSLRRQEASKQACQQLQELTAHAPFVLSFASIGSEIDLWPYNRYLAQEGRLVLPRIVDRELHLYQVKDFDCLETHRWGVPEPIPSLCASIEPSKIAIALIPGLGFDTKTNHRLGYGGGYYDRLLTKLKATKTWGIGFTEQNVYGLPYDSHDQTLNKIFLF